MKAALTFQATGKWIYVLLIQIIIWQRLVADSSDFFKNLSTTRQAPNLADKKSKNDYYEQQVSIMRHNLISEMSKMDFQKSLDQRGEGREKKITNSVFSLGSENISLNLTTTSTKLITKIYFNKKSCDTILSFHNRLRLDFNSGESKHRESLQVAKRRSGKQKNIQWTTDDEVTECKVDKKYRRKVGGITSRTGHQSGQGATLLAQKGLIRKSI